MILKHEYKRPKRNELSLNRRKPSKSCTNCTQAAEQGEKLVSGRCQDISLRNMKSGHMANPDVPKLRNTNRTEADISSLQNI